MSSKFKIGQRIVVRPVAEPSLSLRDSSIEPYVGEPGEVTDLYCISPNPGGEFYIYRVRLGSGKETVVLHEDEIDAR